jgi:hypothetical protein
MEMKVRDQVWLEGKNLQVTGSRKLLPKQYRPFTILEQIRQVVYQLELPASMKVHNIFHVDLLMPYKKMEAYDTPYAQPPPMIKEGKEEYEIELIIRTRR